MSRYLPVDSFNTGTIAAGASVAFNRSFGASNLNIVKIKVDPSGATTGYKLQVFKDAARTQELLATKDQVVTNFYAPTSRSGAEMLEGFVAPYEDLDAGGNLHLYITNHDTVGRNYDIEITCEAPALVGTGGAQTFEGTEPRILLKETDGGTNEKIWDFVATGETLLIRTRTDADGAGVTLLSFTGRSGTAVPSALFSTTLQATQITATTKFSTDDGLVGTPSYTFGSSTGTGMYLVGPNNLGFATTGVLGLQLGSSGSAIFVNSLYFDLPNADVRLGRGGAGVLDLKNGAAAHQLRIFGDATKSVSLLHDGSNSKLSVSAGNFQFGVSGGVQWEVDAAAGALEPTTDGARAIGASGLRVSNIFSVLGTFGIADNKNGDVYIGKDSGASIFLDSAGIGVAAAITARTSRGTQASRTVITSGDNLLVISGQGYNGTTYNTAASIVMAVDGTPGSADMPGRIEFYTTPDGSASPSLRVKINALGEVFLNLPTSAGATGSLWNDSGTVKVA